MKIFNLNELGEFTHVEMSPTEEDVLFSLCITWLVKNAKFEAHEDYVEINLETLHPYIFEGTA